MAIRIALDYDNTYTLDPDAWDEILSLMDRYNFEVKVVTMRSEELDPIGRVPMVSYETAPLVRYRKSIPIIFCDGRPKREVCTGLGWEPNIWIDDTPESITMGSYFTHDMLEIWRANGRN